MRIIPSITGLVTGDPAAEPSGAGGGVDSAGGGTNRKPDEYCPTNHTLLQGILPLSLVERVVELTVPEEQLAARTAEAAALPQLEVTTLDLQWLQVRRPY